MSWPGAATVAERTTAGFAAGWESACACDRTAGLTATTVPSVGTASHSMPLLSKVPPDSPGGNRSGSPTGVSDSGSICRTTP